MKAQWKFFAVALLFVGGALGVLLWKQAQPRRDSVKVLQNFSEALDSGNSSGILDQIVLPKAIAGETTTEQTEFLIKALRDELSLFGIQEIQRHASFGSLRTIFPNECDRWAALAGVKPEDCVAFKMERDGIQAEIVLVRDGNSYRVVRCNNVKQMAQITGT